MATYSNVSVSCAWGRRARLSQYQGPAARRVSARVSRAGRRTLSRQRMYSACLSTSNAVGAASSVAILANWLHSHWTALWCTQECCGLDTGFTRGVGAWQWRECERIILSVGFQPALDHRDGARDHLFAMVHQGIRTTWWIPHAAMKEGGGPHSPTSHSRFKLERIWSTYSNINHRSFIIPLSAFWLRSSLGSICFYQHLIWVRCFALSQQTSTSFPINQQEQHSATSSSTLSPMLNPMRPPYHPQIAHA